MNKKILSILIGIYISTTIFAQYGTPQTAKEIIPTGQLTFQLSLGWGIWSLDLNDPNVKTKPIQQVFTRKPGYCCWLKFRSVNNNPLWFTIKTVFPGYTGNVYQQFLVYHFEGSGDSLQQLIELGKIQPIRITGATMYDDNTSLNGSGLSPFETDTFLRTNGPSGYLKPLQSPKGTQYYMVIQALCWVCDMGETGCIQHCEAPNCKVYVCFGGTCPIPPLTLRNINFSKGSSAITGDVPELNRLAAMLKTDTSLRILIVGFTDSIGDAMYNQQLSEKRANAVQAYLRKRGVLSIQMTVVGRGENEPAVANDTEANRALNRRVVITFISKIK